MERKGKVAKLLLLNPIQAYDCSLVDGMRLTDWNK